MHAEVEMRLKDEDFVRKILLTTDLQHQEG
jgi:hypothetical protein